MTAIRHGDAADHGLTRDQLRHARWAHPVNGVALPRVELDDLRARCRAVGLVLPDGAVFTHLTAARLRGWWLPRIDPFPVIACTDGAAPHHDRRGVYVRRCEIPPHHRTEVQGIPTASPEWTVVEAAEHLRLLDLVVLIDGALQQGATTLERLREAMVPGRRGVRVLRQALGLVDPRSESPWETVLRLVHVLSNIPVTSQVPVRDDHGELLARMDLQVIGTSRFPEYDGLHHSTPREFQRALQRERNLKRFGVDRAGYSNVDILGGLDQIVADAVEALGRPPGSHPTSVIRDELRRSSFTPQGYADLLRRLARFDRQQSPRRSRTASGAK